MKALIVAALALTSLVLAFQPKQPSVSQKPAIEQRPDVGRFQIIIRPGVRADTFLLDTATGKVWIPVEYTNVKGQPTLWQYQEKADNIEELMNWQYRQPAIEPPKAK